MSGRGDQKEEGGSRRGREKGGREEGSRREGKSRRGRRRADGEGESRRGGLEQTGKGGRGRLADNSLSFLTLVLFTLTTSCTKLSTVQ